MLQPLQLPTVARIYCQEEVARSYQVSGTGVLLPIAAKMGPFQQPPAAQWRYSWEPR